MSDKEMNDMGMEEQERLGQMVTEALLRDGHAAPDASSEWQKLAARMSANLDDSTLPQFLLLPHVKKNLTSVSLCVPCGRLWERWLPSP